MKKDHFKQDPPLSVLSVEVQIFADWTACGYLLSGALQIRGFCACWSSFLPWVRTEGVMASLPLLGSLFCLLAVLDSNGSLEQQHINMRQTSPPFLETVGISNIYYTWSNDIITKITVSCISSMLDIPPPKKKRHIFSFIIPSANTQAKFCLSSSIIVRVRLFGHFYFSAGTHDQW